MTDRLRRLSPGDSINDRYTVTRKLGNDGYVYEAHDGHLDRDVAIKLLSPTAGASSRMWHEAHLLQRLESRCLIQVLNADVDNDSDVRFVVTPLIGGGDLEREAKDLGLGVRKAGRFMRHIVAGIDRIHADGMIHRDIKPANVLLENDDVKVSDLGCCHLLDKDGTAPREGTFQTAAPEVLSGELCTISSEIYSLGATAYYLLSGQYPVTLRVTVTEQVERIKVGNIRNLRDVAPHVPQSVATVVRKALSLDPDKRHRTAEEFGNALVVATEGRRDWERVTHAGHEFCVSGEEYGAKKGVTICSEAAGAVVKIRARYAVSGRRPSSVADATVSPTERAKNIRALVTSLS